MDLLGSTTASEWNNIGSRWAQVLAVTTSWKMGPKRVEMKKEANRVEQQDSRINTH